MVQDDVPAAKSLTWAFPYGATQTPHRITACNNAGNLQLCADGVDTGATVSGVGTGRWTANPTIGSILGGNTGAIRQWDGDISNFKLCKGATRCSDCP